MHYRYLGRTGLKVSQICLGAMTFGNESDESTSFAIMNRFYEQGGNFIDTANVYSRGVSEEIVGKWLKPRRREIVVATKFRFPMSDSLPNEVGASRYHIMNAVEDSLRRLQVEAIDLYQIHCWDIHTPVDETLRALDDLVRQGKVRYLGASNYAGWHLAKALGVSERMGWARFECVQPEYNLIARGIEYELVPACEHENISIIAWSPLAGGFLTGKYTREADLPAGTRLARNPSGIMENSWERRAQDRNWEILDAVKQIAAAHHVSPAQVALAWVIAQPGITAPIVGARNMQQFDDNLAALNLQLSANELDHLTALSTPEEIYPYRFIRDMGQWNR